MPAYRTRETSSRTLEVSTDAPFPPTVAIISPTPRAFTFPINPDVHYASPSSSPFEPNLKPFTPPPARPLSPTSSIGSDVSSALSTPSARSSQASHKRRRSTASDIGERRPKKGDEDYIKRPENAFILFRRKCCEDRQAREEADDGTSGPIKKQRQADLSKTISQQWKSLSAKERVYWEELAKEKKKEHEAMYPNYVYRPQRVKDKAKAKKGKGKGGDGDQETDAESSISFVVPVPSPPRSISRDSLPVGRGHNRRAASAPTPPPAFQTIKVPPVLRPSCPTSPSFVPRISRRSPHPRIPPVSDSDPLTHFEYLPNDTLLPPTFHQPSAFEPSAQADQLYQMFQLEQPSFSGHANNGVLHPLTIPRDPSRLSSSLVSPVDSISSSQLFSPVDPFTSPISPASQPGAPFTPVDALSLMSLSLANNNGCGQVPENVGADMDPSEMAFAPLSWPDCGLWPDDTMIPDDFDLNSIPPIELGISQFDGEMQQLAAMSTEATQGFEFDIELDAGEFPQHALMGQEHDLHDANSGHDPYGIFGTYDDPNMTW